MNQDTYTSSVGRLIALGEIVGTHGIRGLVRFHSYSHSSNQLPTGHPVYLTSRPVVGARPESSTDPQRIVLETVHPHGNVLLLRISGIDGVEAAAALVGHVIALPEDELSPPASGEFYIYQLEGLDVVTSNGDRVGTIDRMFPTGANEVLVVRDGAREYLIPMIADVVRTIDLTAGRVVIEPIAGLLDP